MLGSSYNYLSKFPMQFNKIFLSVPLHYPSCPFVVKLKSINHKEGQALSVQGWLFHKVTQRLK
jgi:hypothetical protein